MSEASEKQGRIFSGDGTSHLPCLYVATALSSLNPDQRSTLDGWCTAVDRAIIPLSGDPAWLRVHQPFKLSASWLGDGRSPEEIYRKNWRHVCTETDGFILFAQRGGSIGAGQELAWAQKMGIPILVLAHGRDPEDLEEGEENLANADTLSRQLLGAASDTDLKIRWFSSTEKLETVVREWVRQRRGAIEDRHRLRRMHRQRAATPLAVFNAAASRFSPDVAREVAALTRLHPRRVEHLLASEDALLAASLDELLRLSTGLGIDLGEALSPRRRTLQPKQLEALSQAATENEWPPEQIVAAVERGQFVLASDGVRRLPLSNPEGWLRLMGEDVG